MTFHQRQGRQAPKNSKPPTCVFAHAKRHDVDPAGRWLERRRPCADAAARSGQSTRKGWADAARDARAACAADAAGALSAQPSEASPVKPVSRITLPHGVSSTTTKLRDFVWGFAIKGASSPQMLRFRHRALCETATTHGATAVTLCSASGALLSRLGHRIRAKFTRSISRPSSGVDESENERERRRRRRQWERGGGGGGSCRQAAVEERKRAHAHQTVVACV